VSKGNSEDESSLKRRFSVLSEKTLMPATAVIMLLTVSYWLGQLVKEVETDRVQRLKAEADFILRLSQIQKASDDTVKHSEMKSWTRLLITTLGINAQNQILEWPK
jgi:hypothetical protein